MNKSRKFRDGMYIFWSIAIILVLILVFATLILSSCSKTGTEDTRVPPTNAPVTEAPATAEPEQGEQEAPDAQGSAILQPTEDAGQEYIDKIVFLGDSTTYGLKFYGMLSGGKETNRVWTPQSGTLTLNFWKTTGIVYPETGTEIVMTEAVTLSKPEILCITLGVNGITMLDETAFKKTYADMVRALQEASPETKIIINSMYPVEAIYEAKNNGINNERISAANEWLKAVAAETGTKYAETNLGLMDENGKLKAEMGNGDGIHLGPDGFNKVLEYLRTHAYP
jgi:lysophospholipase L1-like esterase